MVGEHDIDIVDNFKYNKWTDDDYSKISNSVIDFETAKKVLSSDKVTNFDVFVKIKDQNIYDFKKVFFGVCNNGVEIDNTDLFFIGTVLNQERTISNPVEILDSIKPFIETIFI